MKLSAVAKSACFWRDLASLIKNLSKVFRTDFKTALFEFKLQFQFSIRYLHNQLMRLIYCERWTLNQFKIKFVIKTLILNKWHLPFLVIRFSQHKTQSPLITIFSTTKKSQRILICIFILKIDNILVWIKATFVSLHLILSLLNLMKTNYILIKCLSRWNGGMNSYNPKISEHSLSNGRTKYKKW